MYSTIIELKKNVTGESLSRLRKIAEDAFSNRAGILKNIGNEPHRLIFEGNEEAYGCLDLGVLRLAKSEGFRDQVASWHWVDYDDPHENCDILAVYAEPVY